MASVNKKAGGRENLSSLRYIKGLFHLEEIVLGAQDWAKAGKVTVVDVSYNISPRIALLTQSRSEDLPAMMPSN